MSNFSFNNNLIFVNTKYDLPQDISGVRYLNDNATYFFTDTVDLEGDRLVCGQNTTLIGGSSENCRIKSTGLVGQPLISSNYSLPIRNLTIEADLALNLSGDSVTTALDWFGVNFTDCNNVGTISNYSNVIMQDSAFLNSGGLTFGGTIGTIGFNQCLFNCNSGNTAIILPSGLTITRRFRTIYSSFIVLAGETGISFNTGTTVPTEGYILDTVNFAGGGTYTSGVGYQDNKARWKDCVGVTNSVTVANMYMKNNAIANDILVAGDRYPMSGVTESNTLNQRFSHNQSNNTLEYLSPIPRVCKIQVSFTFNGPSNAVCGFYVGVNTGGTINATADRKSESEVYITASGTRPDSGFIQTLTTLKQGDRVYFIVQNQTNTSDITVQFMNMIIEVSPQD